MDAINCMIIVLICLMAVVCGIELHRTNKKIEHDWANRNNIDMRKGWE